MIRLARGRRACAAAALFAVATWLSAPAAVAAPAYPAPGGPSPTAPASPAAVPVAPEPAAEPTAEPTPGPAAEPTAEPTAGPEPAPRRQPAGAAYPDCTGGPGYGDAGPYPPPGDACLVATDFGDAPDSYGTLYPSGGPGHLITSLLQPGVQLTIGGEIDDRVDGLPTEAADGDDLDQPVNDEDALPAGTVFDLSGTTLDVPVVNTTGAPATLAGWIDLDLNGRFDVAERAVAAVPPGAGTATLVWPPAPDARIAGAARGGGPLGAAAPRSAGAASYLRLRLYPESIGEPVPTGSLVVEGGEVEDHRIFVSQVALPRTGAGTVRIVLCGLALIGCGAVVAASARRRSIRWA